MLSQALIQPLLHLAIILPLLLFFLKERSRKNYLRVGSIILCYYLCCVALFLPHLVDWLHIIDGKWNWNGKVYSILCGIAMYFAFRKQLSNNDFFTLKQNKEGLKAGLKAAITIFAFSVLPILLAQQVEQLTIHKEFDPETLLFQLTMPGIDEEIFFRGILLGLMCSTLRSGTSAWSNPAIIINAILFGLGHALRFYEGEATFSTGVFIATAISGYAFAYIAFKTRSLLIPILTHNLCNFTKNLLWMFC